MAQQARVAEEQVHQMFERLNPARDERGATLLQEIEAARHQKEKALRLQKDELEFWLSGIRDVASFGEWLLREGSKAEIAASQRAVKTRLQTLIKGKERAMLEPATDTLIALEKEDDWVNSAGDVISNVGCISTNESISAASSRMSGSPEANITRNREYSFQVTFGDKKGREITTLDNQSLSCLVVKIDGPTTDPKVSSLSFCFLFLVSFLLFSPSLTRKSTLSPVVD